MSLPGKSFQVTRARNRVQTESGGPHELRRDLEFGTITAARISGFKTNEGHSLVVQWLELHTFTVLGTDLIPGRGN